MFDAMQLTFIRLALFQYVELFWHTHSNSTILYYVHLRTFRLSHLLTLARRRHLVHDNGDLFPV